MSGRGGAARGAVKVLYSGNLGRKQGLGQVLPLLEDLASSRTPARRARRAPEGATVREEALATFERDLRDMRTGWVALSVLIQGFYRRSLIHPSEQLDEILGALLEVVQGLLLLAVVGVQAALFALTVGSGAGSGGSPSGARADRPKVEERCRSGGRAGVSSARRARSSAASRCAWRPRGPVLR